MNEKSSTQANRPSFWQGFSNFHKQLFDLAQFKGNLIYLGMGTLLAALLISIVIAVIGYGFYAIIPPITGFAPVVPSTETTPNDTQNALIGSYLVNLCPNLVVVFISLILVSGWWIVFRYEREMNAFLDVLLDKDAPPKRRIEALSKLKENGELQKGRLKGKNLVRFDINPEQNPNLNYSWRDANLQNVTFTDGSLKGCNFRGATIQGAIFRGVDLERADFTDVDMTDVDMLDAQNTEKIIFNMNTVLPMDIHNKKKSPVDKDKFLEMKQKALDESIPLSSEYVWRNRLWCRFTKKSWVPEIPPTGSSEEEKRDNALRIKYETLIEEFKYTSPFSKAHIYATAYVKRSIWFPALNNNRIHDEKVRDELRTKYWQAHEDALNRGIKITRIFVIDHKTDLDKIVDNRDGAETVISLINKQDAAPNLETGICLLKDFNSSYGEAINSGTEDFVIFDDMDNPRCYFLSNFDATTVGSIDYADKKIYDRLNAFKLMLEHRDIKQGR